jgi:DNA processing protein
MDLRSEGPNAMIRDGATLVTAAADVIGVIKPLIGQQPPAPPRAEPGNLSGELSDDLFSLAGESILAPDAGETDAPAPPDEAAVLLELLGTTPVHIDELIRLSGLPARTVQSLLMELELDNQIRRHGGNTVSKA